MATQNEVPLVLFITMTVQLLVVAAVVTLVLAVIGALLVRRETVVQWTGLEDADWAR